MKVIILVVLVAAAVNGQSFISRPGSHKDHPNQCFFTESTPDKSVEKVMNFDEIYRPLGVCIKAKCRSDVILDLHYCQKYNVPDGCEVIKKDLTKEWPQCCEKLKCKDSIRDITTESV